MTARQADYANEKAALERKAGTGAVRELKYPMHGTPERWRATAIAVNGFDLSITLNGRAAGNGVYSVINDPTTPLSYTRSGGSLLVMKALYTPEGLANRGASPTDGSVLVFANPKHVLPEAIIDFAQADQEKATIAKLHAEQAAEIKRLMEEHEAVRSRHCSAPLWPSPLAFARLTLCSCAASAPCKLSSNSPRAPGYVAFCSRSEWPLLALRRRRCAMSLKRRRASQRNISK